MYSVVIDAGSSGSRAYVYKWPAPGHTEEPSVVAIETHADWVTRVNPGISSFYQKSKKEIWQEHLSPLMEGVYKVIPRSERKETPVFFLATAGMRLLEKPDRDALLENVCGLLKSKTVFAINDCARHVSMIDGETEGLYGWLGLNYLIHTRDQSLWTASQFQETYGFMDMGGASTQIAFVPNPGESERHHDDLYTVSLRTSTGEPLNWKLFVTTWLGFGANQAQQRWRDLIFEQRTQADLDAVEHGSPLVLPDPCLQIGAFYHDDREIQGKKIETIFHGTGDFKKCEAQLELLLNADKPCKDEPCLFDGVHVPAFDVNLQKFIGISEYWYSAQDLFHLNGKFDYATFLQKAADFCQQEWPAIESNWEKGDYGSGFDKSHLQTGCFKSAWVLTILHKGFKFPLNPSSPTGDHGFLDAFQSAATVGGLEMSWTMGKAIMYASSQIPSSSAHQVGFVSNSGAILTEEPVFIVKKSYGLTDLVFLLMCVGMMAWAYRSLPTLRKRARRVWQRVSQGDGDTLPELERPVAVRGWQRTPSAGSVPVYPQFELNDMSSPGMMSRSPVFGQFHDGISSSVPVSRAPSRIGSRLNISTMKEDS